MIETDTSRSAVYSKSMYSTYLWYFYLLYLTKALWEQHSWNWTLFTIYNFNPNRQITLVTTMTCPCFQRRAVLFLVYFVFIIVLSLPQTWAETDILFFLSLILLVTCPKPHIKHLLTDSLVKLFSILSPSFFNSWPASEFLHVLMWS